MPRLTKAPGSTAPTQAAVARGRPPVAKRNAGARELALRALCRPSSDTMS